MVIGCQLSVISTARQRPAAGAGTDGGSALIVVLWVVGLLALFIGSFAFDAHIEARITSHYRKRAKAEQIAKSGIEVARMLMIKSAEVRGKTKSDKDETDQWFDLAKTFSQGLPLTGGSRVSKELGEGTLVLEISPEPALRNINNLGKSDPEKEENLEKILEVGGIPQEMFPALIESFLDWTDADDIPRQDGAETDDYYGKLEPPRRAQNGPLDEVDELKLVRGFNSTILYGGVISTGRTDEETITASGIKDLLTTFGDGKVNVNAASKRVLMTLPGIDDPTADDIIAEREGKTEAGIKKEDSAFRSPDDFMSRFPGLPPALKGYITTDSTIFRITSVGNVQGVSFRASCIAQYGSKNLTILRWTEE